jgi:hypothetical protein
VDNAQYRLLKATTPGSYTFILEGTKELPRRILHPKRKTIGLRMPDHAGPQALLAELERAAADLDPATARRRAPAERRRRKSATGWKAHRPGLEAGACGLEPTTVVDLTGSAPELVRAGMGFAGTARAGVGGLVESRAYHGRLIQTLAIYALPVIFAITLHEAAHGYVARHFGDPTAYLAGRISLNPLRHIDPVGTILVPGAILVASKLIGGSACCSAGPSRCRSISRACAIPKQDMLWVAAAGPGANLLMAVGWAALLKMATTMPSQACSAPSAAGCPGRHRDQCRADGAQPAADSAARRRPHRRQPAAASLAWQFSRLEPYGLAILLVLLLFTGVYSAGSWAALGAVLPPARTIFTF